MNRRVPGLALAAALMWPGATMEAAAQAEPPIEIAESGCTAARLGVSIDTDLIGEPVSGVSVAPPVWRAAAGRTPAHCSVDGAMAPIVTAGERSLPMCSYPEYPRYVDGPEDSADSYRCSRP